MSRDEIIAMAKEAGLLPDNSHPAPETRAMRQRTNAVQRFAALVAAQEREACAQVCEKYGTSVTTKDCATAIRERGKP